MPTPFHEEAIEEITEAIEKKHAEVFANKKAYFKSNSMVEQSESFLALWDPEVLWLVQVARRRKKE